MIEQRRPTGILLLAVFFSFGAAICLLTLAALLCPGGALEPIWDLKSEARLEFKRIGIWAILLMATVGAACAASAVGLAKMKDWGRQLAIAVLTVNLAGDTLNAAIRHDPRTLIGVPIGAVLIFYLLKKRHLFRPVK
jgi:hypothetical protein